MRTTLLTITLCLLALGLTLPALATPTTTFWTPMSMDFQAPGVWHFGMDNYSTLGKNGTANGGEAFPIDYGLTVGKMLSPKISSEYGIDYFSPTDEPIYLNAKLGYAEGALSPTSPALELGLANFGLRRGVTNQDIAYLLYGKSLPNGLGRLMVSYYAGNAGVLKSSDGKVQNTGYMLAYDRPLIPGKLSLAADYASGKNAIGGGGVGLGISFNKDASVLIGPVWFNDQGINGKMKWTAQIDINFDAAGLFHK